MSEIKMVTEEEWKEYTLFKSWAERKFQDILVQINKLDRDLSQWILCRNDTGNVQTEILRRLEIIEARQFDSTTIERMKNISCSKPPIPPKGFALTGECRPPKVTEWFVTANNIARTALMNYSLIERCWILIKQPDIAPSGFEFTGEYRAPKQDEWFKASNDNIAVECFVPVISDNRWILRPISKVHSPKRWVFEETGEIGTRAGQLYIHDGQISFAYRDNDDKSSCRVVKLVEETK